MCTVGVAPLSLLMQVSWPSSERTIATYDPNQMLTLGSVMTKNSWGYDSHKVR